MTHSGSFRLCQTPFDPFWINLTLLDSFRFFLTPFDPFWIDLTLFDHFYLVSFCFTRYDTYWLNLSLYLTNSDSFWYIQLLYDLIHFDSFLCTVIRLMRELVLERKGDLELEISITIANWPNHIQDMANSFRFVQTWEMTNLCLLGALATQEHPRVEFFRILSPKLYLNSREKCKWKV